MSEQKESAGYSLKIGRLAKRIMEIDKKGFSTDFEENKKLIKKFLPTISKQMQNKIAGYIIRFMENEKE
jgi:ribosomal protein S17E